MTYIPPGFSNSSASSSKRYFPAHVSAKIKSNRCPRSDCKNSSPSAHTTFNRGSELRWRLRIDNKTSSLSTVVRCDPASIPSINHAADNPVPEPNSRKRADGFDDASVRSSEHVRGSDAMLKPEARVSAQIAGRTFGSLRLERSYIFEKV
jgi:hypothetical protein